MQKRCHFLWNVFFTAWLPSLNGGLQTHGIGMLLQDAAWCQVLHTVYSKRERWWIWLSKAMLHTSVLFDISHIPLPFCLSVLCGLMTELQWSFRITPVSAMKQIKARWQEYCWGELGGFCGVVLVWFGFLRLGLFLSILNYIQKCRTLDTYHLYWKFARLLRITTNSHAVAIKGKKRTIIAPNYLSKA